MNEQHSAGSTDEEVCERCHGAKLVTIQCDWRGAVCDADDQPCPECSGVCCGRSVETGGQRHDIHCGRGPV